ncbi:hypothetical protein Q5P01_002363 [Channa striata]|uniref:C-type lectin domain-containing protein n=1 Tax=Channa striata TaxID=64152 RepID=A0AA88NQX1_CHASR|nr:hypothetical protein Q5P01_002363 [Channa striata]
MKTLMLLVLLCATVTLSGATRPFLFLYFPSAKSRLFKRSLLCPAAWLEREGRCFRYVPTRLTWAKGREVLSGHGCKPCVCAQRRRISRHPETHSKGHTREGIWLWSDGSPFNYRHCGRFDNRWWKQHCLQMNYGANKCWDDVQCYAKLPSVCAKKPRTRLG